MNDETTTDEIVECDSLTADDLYEIQQEAQYLDCPVLEARVDIERRNLFLYEDYVPVFTREEVFEIGMALLSAKQQRYRDNMTHRVAEIDDVAAVFLDEIQDGGDSDAH